MKINIEYNNEDGFNKWKEEVIKEYKTDNLPEVNTPEIICGAILFSAFSTILFMVLLVFITGFVLFMNSGNFKMSEVLVSGLIIGFFLLSLLCFSVCYFWDRKKCRKVLAWMEENKNLDPAFFLQKIKEKDILTYTNDSLYRFYNDIEKLRNKEILSVYESFGCPTVDYAEKRDEKEKEKIIRTMRIEIPYEVKYEKFACLYTEDKLPALNISLNEITLKTAY